jgi:hypothetical protein
MKILMLIISSDNEHVYAEHRKFWLTYMNSSPSIEAYFIQYRNGPQEIQGNTFWLSGKESLKHLTTKTIDSMKYFLTKDSYDFIVRTNMSSFWNFKALIKFLETLPKQNVYSGIIGNHNGIPFVSGSGFIMSNDVAKLLIDNRNIAESVCIVDDVDIGYTMDKLGVPFSLGKRTDFYSMNMYLNHIYDTDTYHYRIKWNDSSKRLEEVDVMWSLISKQCQ